MIREKRFEFILKSLTKKSEVTFEDLAEKLAVSDDTIRRDIEYLHKNGLLSKVRGGAIPRSKNPLTFHDRQGYLKKEKDVIALKAQQLIKGGMTLFMDGGTTVCAVAQYFPLDIKLRVITNNYTLIAILAAYRNVEVIAAGGNYDADLQIFTGYATCASVQEYTADLHLMGICGVDPKFGVSTNFQQDADVKRVMKKNARKVVVLANHERLGVVDAFRVCEIQEVDVLVTDINSDDEDLGAFRNLGIQII
jgi:DeoR/GlpR family transcriptional regulator of sugar metabolism